MDYFDILKRRGFVYQLSDEEEIKKIIKNKGTFYIGFDPTADSLHLGSMFALMSIAHLSRAGLTPIILVGGATGLVGDPSGKTELRNVLSEKDMNSNLNAIEKQIRSILPEDTKPIFVNNADWLRNINLVDFLRDVGRYFSVNRMLTQDCVKSRLEKGITYLEFSYMLLQAYDFTYLNKKYNCLLQIGGADQWGNMVMGMDLTRRINQNDVHCMTFEPMMTSKGGKMGKTAEGTIWLDAKKTSPYNYYQYWVNVDDKDVKRFLYRYTYLEDSEIEKISSKDGSEINEAKKVLAFEATKILHGEEEAIKAKKASLALFSGDMSENANVPSFSILKAEGTIIDMLINTKLVSTKSEARRLIDGGGVYVNSNRISGYDETIKPSDFKDGFILVRIGKKKYLKIVLNDKS
jgi:tyrosyl-tRNA synthetase